MRGDAWLADYTARREAWEARRDETDAPARSEPTPAPPLPDALVVVSGLPRSGTSMLMQMLVAGGLTPFVDGERVPDASNPRGYLEHQKVRTLARDTSWLSEADGTVLKVVSPLLPYLPPGPAYRVLLLNRDVDEVLRSQSTMLDALGRRSANADALRPVYVKHQDAARQWIASTPAATGLELDHRDVIRNPLAAARRIEAFLQLGLDLEAMAHAVDPSLHRQKPS